MSVCLVDEWHPVHGPDVVLLRSPISVQWQRESGIAMVSSSVSTPVCPVAGQNSSSELPESVTFEGTHRFERYRLN